MSYENKTMNLKLENSYANGLKEQNWNEKKIKDQIIT